MTYELPDIVTLEHHGGDPMAYLEATYQIFRNDFVVNKPVFRTKRLALKRYPIVDGKEYTYYHFTHDGDVETERIPNLRRMERIPWPSPMINDSEHAYLKVWRNKRGSSNRILIFHEDEGYLVILDDRRDYILPWTAFYVEQDNRRQRLLKEYEEYKKAEAAQN